MTNSGEEYFFRKPIHITSPFSHSLATTVTFEGKPQQNQIKGLIGLTNTLTKEDISLENVSIYDENGKIEYWTEGKQLSSFIRLMEIGHIRSL